MSHDSDDDLPERFRHITKASDAEIRLRQKLYPDVSVVEDAKIQCTICLKDVKHVFLLKKKSYKHRILQVVVCKSCLQFYGDGDFSADEDGIDKYCRWCGQGGSLYVCSKCPSTFCKKCIKQNLERKFMLLVENDDWCCFICDPSPLYKLRALLWAVDQHLKNEKTKEEKAKKKLKSRPKGSSRSSLKPVHAAEMSEEYFQTYVDSAKLWLSGLMQKIDPADTATARFKDCSVLLENLNHPADLENLSTSLLNFVDLQIDAMDNFRKELLEGLAKITKKCQAQRQPPGCGESEHSNGCTEVTHVDRDDDLDATVDATNGNDVHSSHSASMDMFEDCGEKEDNSVDRPVIRLRSLSELMAPHVKDDAKAKRKPRRVSPEAIQLSSDDEDPNDNTRGRQSRGEKSKSKTNLIPNPKVLEKSSLELKHDSYMENSSRQESAPSTSKRDSKTSRLVENPKSKKCEENLRKGSTKNRDNVGSRSSSDASSDRSRRPNHEKDKGATVQPLFVTTSESELEVGVEPKKISSSSESQENNPKKENQTKVKSSKVASSTPRIAMKTSKSTSDSTSSTDPLSEGSGDECKINRSYFTDSDEDNKSKKTVTKKKRKTRPMSESDSSLDNLLKIKKIPSTSKKSKKDTQKQGKTDKSRSTDVSSDEDDFNITKLCDLRTLKAKRTMSADSLTLSEDEPVKPKTNKKKSKKVNSVPDKLEDHYDPTNNLEREDQEEDEIEDLNTTFQREFAHINERSYVEDMTGDFLRLSSSDEEKGNLSPEEEQPKKRKRTKGPANTKEGRKGKKQYPDKLMKMKIDSDSDDLEQGEKKYEEHKKKQAGKNRKSSDEDVPKAKPGRPKRVAPRKKMFSDSDLSDDEAESEKEEVKKPSENGSGADSDFDAKAAQSSQKGSESDSGSIEVQPKKRKRIKRQSGSSSSDDDNDGGGKRQSKKDSLNDSRGRKNIKKILKEDDLKQTTQAALKAEQERKKRIEEKQKLYNQLMKPANELSAHTELSELVLDFDAKTKEKLVVVDSDLVKKLKPHQAEGVKFMWDSCFESLAMTKKKSGSGCILAHCMGLGKSLQVVTLVHTLITHEEIGVKKVMVVTPLSTVLNWVNEFDKWLKDVGSGQDVNVFHMNKTQPSYRSYLVKDWARQGGVLILGYNLLRALTNPKARMKPSFKKVFHENLLDPGPDVVICDEGHILKNEKTAINQCMTQIKTKRRIVLTGTPLQNNLVEYHCMVQFVKPNLLGTKKEFKNRFVNPITNGQFEDSTAHDVKIMKRRAHVLHTMLDGLVQRKDYSVLTPYLPPKYEFVIHLKLSDVQVKLYRHYLLNVVHGGSDTSEAPKGKRLFVDFQNLMWICLHPRTLLMKADKDEKKAFMEESDEEGSLKDFIDDDKSTSESDFKTSSSSESESSVKSVEKPTRKKTRRQGSVSDDEPAPPPRQWWTDLIEEANMDDIKSSSKLFLFFTILKYCEEIGDKLLVFSQSLYTLDIIEYFLDKIDVETQKPEEERCPGIKGFEGNWAKGQDYFRLDGSSACENRESWCKSFNVGENRARLFLISTRAGGLGINLTGANRVIIFDASWNPSFDVQSLFRIYRFGQDKPCYIYRFLSKGTMEEKVYERQVAKLSTSLRVIDEHQIDRHFSHSALAELYMFNPEGSELQGTPLLPKDRLMADLLSMHGDIILSYHQHDSLLQNQEDQELTEEERKAAWTEFENEKNQVPQPGFSLGIVASMMAEIRAKLKQLNPNMTEEQIHAMAIDAFQRLPDYPAMAPYVNVFQQQMSMMQQARAQGMLVGTNPMFPGLRMPSFQYPQFNNSQAAMLANMNAMKRMNNPDPNQLRPPSFNFQQLLDNYTNPATSNASMVANPKHTSGPVIQSTTSLQPRAAAGSSTSAGDNDVVVLD